MALAGPELPGLRRRAEIYCHSLGRPEHPRGPELRASGAQTLTVFGLHNAGAPVLARAGAREDALDAVLRFARLRGARRADTADCSCSPLPDGEPCVEASPRRSSSPRPSSASRAATSSTGDLAWPLGVEEEGRGRGRWGVETRMRPG